MEEKRGRERKRAQSLTTLARGEANSKPTLLHILSNIKECVQFQRKYMENLR